VTTVVQTLIDMAPRLGRDAREGMIGEADRRRLIDPSGCAERWTPRRASRASGR
jgi:hypothetical protein